MKMKNTAAICAAVGVCILTSAAFASYQAGNGYDTLKSSLLGTLDYTNCTVSYTMGISFDGTKLAEASCEYEADLPNNMTHSRTESTSYVSGDTPYVSESYEDGSYYYYQYYDNNSSETDGFLRHPYDPGAPATNLLGIPEEERGTFDKVIRFMELASDTVVGDLRNNFVCVEDTGEHSAYSITLDSVQIPELVNAGLSMVFSLSETGPTYVSYDENGNETVMTYDESDTQYYINMMGPDPVIDNLTLSFTAGSDGVFRDGTADVTFKGTDSSGTEHTMSFNVSLSFTDVGTTAVTPVSELGVNVYEYDDYGNRVAVTF